MAKPKNKISKDEMRTLVRGARRAVDVAAGIGINMKHNVFVDKKKKANRGACRKGVNNDNGE